MNARGFVSSLARARGAGSARTGTERFVFQRASALALIPLMGYCGYLVFALIGAARAEALATLGAPFTAFVVGATFVLLAAHMRAGLLMVVEDYVAAPHARALCALAVHAFSAFVGFGAAAALLWTALEARG